ncbi:MAG: hypothetical protein JWO97_3832 [Acidobacteria bacterium]|nr:hypothetical protein [Acidobacteriota bacterium]
MRRALCLLATVIAVDGFASAEWKGTLCRTPRGGSGEVCMATTSAHIVLDNVPAPVPFRWIRADGKVLLFNTSRSADVQLDEQSFGAVRFRVDPDPGVAAERRAAAVTLTSATSTWTIAIPVLSLSKLEEIRLPEGEYRLALAVPGWEAVYRSALRVRRLVPVQLGHLAMTRMPRITGRVIDAARKEAVAQATVLSPEGVALATTDAGGGFVVEGLSEIPLFLTVTSSDRAPAAVALRRTDFMDIDVGDILLEAGGSLHLHLARKCPAPCTTTLSLMRPVELDPRPNRWETIRTVSLPAEADVAFEHLESGRYVIVLRGAGPLEQRIVEAEVKNAKSESLAIDLEPTALRGFVTSAGERVARATLRFTTNERIWNGQVMTDEHGEYATERWQNGSLRVTVQPPGETERYTLERSLSEADTEWQLTLPAARITGRVIEKESGTPVAGARVFDEVSAERFHSAGHFVTTDDDGRYAFAMARTGRHVIHIESDSHQDAPPVTLQIAGDEPVQDVDFALSRGNATFIRVVDKAERAIAEAFIVDRLPPDGYPNRSGITTDATGAATLPLSEGEKRRIWIVAPDGRFTVATLDAADRTSREEPRLLVIEAPTASLRFRVTRNGKAAAAANILIQRDGLVIPPGVLEMIAFQQRASAITDDRGVAVLPQMPSGSYIVAAYRGLDQFIDIRAHRLEPETRRATVAGGIVEFNLEEPGDSR